MSESLGTGQFGAVHLAIDLVHNTKMARKTVTSNFFNLIIQWEVFDRPSHCASPHCA